MSRTLVVGAAQLGPIARDEPRESAVARMVNLLERASHRGADLVVFPELALTTFFPRWYTEDQDEIDRYFEREMPNEATRPLFEAARRLQCGFHLGYAELCEEGGSTHRFNTAVLVDKTGTIVGKYRKIHLPGHREHEPGLSLIHI